MQNMYYVCMVWVIGPTTAKAAAVQKCLLHKADGRNFQRSRQCIGIVNVLDADRMVRMKQSENDAK